MFTSPECYSARDVPGRDLRLARARHIRYTVAWIGTRGQFPDAAGRLSGKPLRAKCCPKRGQGPKAEGRKRKWEVCAVWPNSCPGSSVLLLRVPTMEHGGLAALRPVVPCQMAFHSQDGTRYFGDRAYEVALPLRVTIREVVPAPRNSNSRAVHGRARACKLCVMNTAALGSKKYAIGCDARRSWTQDAVRTSMT